MGIIDDLKMEYRVGGITQRLIFWNVGLFVIPLIVFSLLKLGGIYLPALDWNIGGTQNWFSLSSNPADLLWKPWSLITYAFLHASFGHIFFNMIMLYFSGRLFLTFFTQKQLFGVYILSAIFSGLIFIAGYQFIPMLRGASSPMVGASAAIMAILFATVVYAPYYPVRLLLIGTVKLWYIAAFFLAIDMINASVSNYGGHIAHLAGALFGFVYIKLLQNGTDLSTGVTVVIDFFANLFKPKKYTPFKTVHRNTTPAKGRTAASAKPKDLTQQQIDDILDKISKSGYDSLTKEEKEFLFKMSK
ncbi:rhomboid family intramembrane serine protease [Flavobacterium rhizosphaerae]|uniref:Rhomboid family intramembrane serine protease n=1 Tax=Flavobacterium rhizosphaerae TaxID=3163298 RepID=A0ABW8YR91_9FLAO